MFFLRVCGGWAERETDTRRLAGAHQEEPGGSRRDQEAVRRYQENLLSLLSLLTYSDYLAYSAYSAHTAHSAHSAISAIAS